MKRLNVFTQVKYIKNLFFFELAKAFYVGMMVELLMFYMFTIYVKRFTWLQSYPRAYIKASFIQGLLSRPHLSKAFYQGIIYPRPFIKASFIQGLLSRPHLSKAFYQCLIYPRPFIKAHLSKALIRRFLFIQGLN